MASHNVFECVRIAHEAQARLHELCMDPALATSALQQAALMVTRENMAEWVDGYDPTSRDEVYVAGVYFAALFQAPEATIELARKVGFVEVHNRVVKYSQDRGYNQGHLSVEERWDPFPRATLLSSPKDRWVGKKLTLRGEKKIITGVRLDVKGLFVTLDGKEYSKEEIIKMF